MLLLFEGLDSLKCTYIGDEFWGVKNSQPSEKEM